jgi:hypothetical protein
LPDNPQNPLTLDSALQLIADEPEFRQLIAQKMKQAEEFAAASGQRHTTGLGALLGGLGDMWRQYSAGKQEREAADAMARQQALVNRARGVVAGQFAGDVPGAPQQTPPDSAPPPMAPRGPGTFLRQAIAASGPQPPVPMAPAQNAPPSSPMLQPPPGSPPPQNARAALAGALSNMDPNTNPYMAELLRIRQTAARVMASGDPTMAAMARTQLDAAEKQATLAMTQQERTETARHNQAGEGATLQERSETARHNRANEAIDLRKLKQESWGTVSDGNGTTIFFDKRDPNQRIVVGPGGVAMTPGTQPPEEIRRIVEAGMRKGMPADERKRLEDSEEAILQITRGQQAVAAQPGAFGVTEQPSDYLPQIKPFGLDIMAPLSAVADAPSRLLRSADEDKARAVVFAQAYQEIHKLAGAALSPGEAARLKTFLPNPNDTVSELTSKLTSAREMATQMRDRLRATYLPGLYPAAQPEPFGPAQPQRASDYGDNGPPKRAKHKLIPYNRVASGDE